MPDKKDALVFSVINSVKDIPQETWDRLFDQEDIEDRGYQLTLEETGLEGFELSYLLAKRDGSLAAVIPFFIHDFSFTTLIQGPLQRFILAWQKIFPRFLKVKILFVGSPTSEKLSLGIAQEENLAGLLEGALKVFSAFCRKGKIPVTLFYNLDQENCLLAKLLKRQSFAKMENYPGTQIEIKWGSLEEYFKSLSKNTRKDLKRKLKKAQELTSLHTEIREDISDIVGEVYRLYTHNLDRTDTPFERLSPIFFANICRNMPGIAKFFLTFDKEKLVAFNLCLVKGNSCIDKFVGFDSEVLRKYHLYFTTFCFNLEWAIKNHIRFYQMGVSDYGPKLRLGAKLIPLAIYLRLLNPFLNIFTPLVMKLIEPKNFDPVLRKNDKRVKDTSN